MSEPVKKPSRTVLFARTATFLGFVAREGAQLAKLLREEGNGTEPVAQAIEAMAAGARTMLDNVVAGARQKAETFVGGVLDRFLR